MKTTPTFLTALLLVSLAAFDVADVSANPIIFWSAEPVMPNEAAVLQGAGFDKEAKIVLQRAGSNDMAPVRVLDANARSLRFVLPKAWPAGMVKCRIEMKSGLVEHTLNAPQP